tara:strand:+ start:4892 stop:5065 length:174 start_codon:yes stop_codon:yes gene_type:complete
VFTGFLAEKEKLFIYDLLSDNKFFMYKNIDNTYQIFKTPIIIFTTKILNIIFKTLTV